MHFNTVSELLKGTLLTLMNSSLFHSFRLVGGTALSLQLGHRISVDIDLFSDDPYGTINFNSIDKFVKETFHYYSHLSLDSAIGKSYVVGTDRINAVKLDFFYSDPFIQPPVFAKGIRMASVEEIIAMKMDVIQRIGRKKDFWDLHELLERHNLSQMIDLHQQRYPYSHEKNLLIKNLTNFEFADDDFEPLCLRGKYWEIIKEDIIATKEEYESTLS